MFVDKKIYDVLLTLKTISVGLCFNGDVLGSESIHSTTTSVIISLFYTIRQRRRSCDFFSSILETPFF